MGEPPPRRDLLGHRLQRAVEPAPRRRPGQLPSGPQAGTPGRATMPLTAAPGPAMTRWTHIGISPTTAPMRTGRRVGRSRQQQPAEHEADGDDEVGPEGEGQAGRGRRRRASTAAGGVGSSRCTPRTANTAPTASGRGRRSTPSPSARSGVMHVEHGERGDARRGQPAPRPGQGEQPEDDAEVLEQAERPLGGQGVAEHLVPAEQDLQRAGPVEVEEVDVGDVALGAAARGSRA